MAATSEFWPFPIGTPGVAWGPEEKLQWKARVGAPKRAYQEEVLAKIEPLKAKFDVSQYGALNYIDAQKFPLFRNATALKREGCCENRSTIIEQQDPTVRMQRRGDASCCTSA